jgi:hypothetical protein
MGCFFQKYQDGDKCGTRIAFIFNIRQCALFFNDTGFYILMLVIGYLEQGQDNSGISSDSRTFEIPQKGALLDLSTLQNEPTMLSRKVAD